MKFYCGIDNGVTGAIGIVSSDGSIVKWFPTPVKLEQSYTKSDQKISRIDFKKLTSLLQSEILDCSDSCKILIERPMVNPGRFKATLSAIRCLEATLIAIEEFQFPLEYLDSKRWQAELLPSNVKKEELKKASKDIGKRLFPKIDFKGHDADALLIAEYARRNNL